MGKLSLKAKNPFGKDIELVSGKTWIGLGAFAIVIVALGGMVSMAKSRTSVVTSGVDGLYTRLRGV